MSADGQDGNFASQMLGRARQNLDRRFVIGPGGSVSYEELDRQSGRYAAALQALGVVPGDRIAVQIDKSIEAVYLYFACLRAGAIFLPLNAAYTLNELTHFFLDATPSLVVCRPQDVEAVGPLAKASGACHCLTLGMDGNGTLMGAIRSQRDSVFRDAAVGPDALAAILYTSGTTGRAKGAMITHGNLSSNAVALAEFWQFTADDVLLHALPIFHIHGLFVAINVVVAAGASLLFLPGFNADLVAESLPRATVMMGVPTFYTRLLGHGGVARERVRHMRLFISGSAPLLADTHRAWRDATGHAILERYGMTETGMNASNPVAGERRAGTVGLPLPGVEIRVVDPETGGELPTDQFGMIEVRGPNVFKGYWGLPEKTKSEFRDDGFFITGDIGKFDAQGYLHIVGRGKDLIISGGYNIYPKEIETEIDALPGVEESAVIGVPHPDFGEGVVAVVVGMASQAQIISGLEGRLARFKQPKRVIAVSSLPRNAMGKVQKNLLREEFGKLFADTEEAY